MWQNAPARWPFIRGPRDNGAFADRVLFSPPALTEYLFDSQCDYYAAVEQTMRIENELSE